MNKRDRLIFRLLTVVFILAVLTGFVLAKLEFDEKAELKDNIYQFEQQIINHEHVQDAAIQQEIMRIKDSLILNHKTIFDTVRYVLPQEMKVKPHKDRFIHPYKLRIFSKAPKKGVAYLLIDKMVYNLQNAYFAPVSYEGWYQEQDIQMPIITYGHDSAKDVALVIADSLSHYVQEPIRVLQVPSKGYDITVRLL